MLGSLSDPESEPYVNFSYFVICAFDKNANLKWHKYWKDPLNPEYGGEIRNGLVLDENQIFLAGSKQPDDGFKNYAFMVNREGDIQWDNVYNASSRNIKLTQNEGDVISVSFPSGTGIFVADFSDDGQLISNNTIPLILPDSLSGIIQDWELTPDKTLHVAYSAFVSTTPLTFYDVILDYDIDNQESQLHFIDLSEYFAAGIENILVRDSSIHIAGFIFENEDSRPSLYHSRLDSERNREWLHEIEFGTNEFADGFHALDDGRVALGIQTQASTLFYQLKGGYHITDASGMRSTDVKDITDSDINYLFYPNPTTGRFTIPELDIKDFFVYNFEGKQFLIHRIDEHNFDSSTLPEGPYLINVVDHKNVRHVLKFIKINK